MRRLARVRVAVALLLVVLAPIAVAEPTGIARYRGMHPLWPQMGGFCYIDVTHVHNKRPTDLRVYRELPDGDFLFVGDPVALGYDGPKYAYFGPHPLDSLRALTVDNTYCYIRGPHFHSEKPEAANSFVAKDGVYWFTGNFSPQFERDRHLFWVNDSAVTSTYQPPKASVADAPASYRFPEIAEIPHVPLPPPPAAGKRPGSDPVSRTKSRPKTDATQGSR